MILCCVGDVLRMVIGSVSTTCSDFPPFDVCSSMEPAMVDTTGSCFIFVQICKNTL